MVLRRASSIAVMVGLFWSGCGGSTSDDSGGEGGSSASAAGGKSAGGAPGQGGKAGSSRGGSATSGSGGEPGQAGAPIEDGGEGGEGGAGASGAPSNPSSCDTPYAGPVAGPRASGPEPINVPCASITDEQVLERYDDNDAKVPLGLFWEPPPGAIWEEPCSDSAAETAANALAADLGAAEGEFETEWFYEATACSGSQRRFYRNLRCDYFDGMTLANGDGQKLGFLASLLWWQDNFNVGGSALLGYAVAIGDATDTVELCTIRTVYGDFGLCDEITLESTVHTVVVGGSVTLGEPEVVRTVQGDCH